MKQEGHTLGYFACLLLVNAGTSVRRFEEALGLYALARRLGSVEDHEARIWDASFSSAKAEPLFAGAEHLLSLCEQVVEHLMGPYGAELVLCQVAASGEDGEAASAWREAQGPLWDLARELREEGAPCFGLSVTAVLDVLREFGSTVVTQHNLLSTATGGERRATLERMIEWWNVRALPVVEGRGRRAVGDALAVVVAYAALRAERGPEESAGDDLYPIVVNGDWDAVESAALLLERALGREAEERRLAARKVRMGNRFADYAAALLAADGQTQLRRLNAAMALYELARWLGRPSEAQRREWLSLFDRESKFLFVFDHDLEKAKIADFIERHLAPREAQIREILTWDSTPRTAGDQQRLLELLAEVQAVQEAGYFPVWDALAAVLHRGVLLRGDPARQRITSLPLYTQTFGPLDSPSDGEPMQNGRLLCRHLARLRGGDAGLESEEAEAQRLA